MQKKAENDFVNEWMENLRNGLKYRKKFSSIDKWDQYRKAYRGDWQDGGTLVPVNRLFSYGRSLIPQVYFQAPRVTGTATHPDLVFHAQVVEEIDNWIIREALLKGTIKKAILDTYLTGTGVVKLGYDSEFGYIPGQAVDEDASTVTQVGKTDERSIEYKTHVKPGLPWGLPVLIEDVITPMGYTDQNSLPWIAHRILRPLEDVQQDQKYRNTKKLQGTRLATLVDETKKQHLMLDEGQIEYAELYEVRDASRKMIYVFCENEILLSDEDALQIEGLPYEFLIFNQDPEHFHGIPDIKILEPQQIELNEIRTQASRHRKIALLKFLYLKGALNKSALDALLSGEVGPGVEVDGESLHNAITTLQPHVPYDLAQERQITMEDMRESMGFSSNELGEFSGYHGKTATETMQVAQSHDNRTGERKDAVADLLVNIVRKWNQYIFSFWSGERVAKIAGPEGTQQWVKYTGDQIKGEYTLSIDPDSGFPVTKQLRAQMADGLMKVYGGDPLVDQTELRRIHLSNFEWVFPGVTRMLGEIDPITGKVLAQERQPSPMMGGGKGQSAQGNRGGGRGPMQAIDFEKAASQFKDKGGG